MGFFFVRRSRYEALSRDLVHWQNEVVRLDRKLHEAEKRLDIIRQLVDGDLESVMEEDR
jgi:hypothetical protein